MPTLPLHTEEGSVMVVERHDATRLMISALLRREGLTVECSAGDPVPSEESFDVIVRDVNVTPGSGTRELELLEAADPAILQRTVITTTSLAAVRAHPLAARVFAVIGKPFEVETLVDAVRRCRARSAPAQPQQVHDDTDEEGNGVVNVDTVVGFVQKIPELRALLQRPAVTSHELLLRDKVRRTVLELAQLLDEASRRETKGDRATVLLEAAHVAADLARSTSPPSRQSGSDH